ncbi:MAG: hypothetical protein N0E57_14740 [Candidatus Thiodiazotropha taylori]|nr:hypothetical protein [Candidatus Thiodiazotropha taylori]
MNKSDDCSASVSYDSHKIFNDGKIDVVFEIAVSDCKFSSGTFDFDVITKDLETDENKTEERGGFWPARDTNPTTITTEKFSLKSGEEFITISRPSEVKCACIDR